MLPRNAKKNKFQITRTQDFSVPTSIRFQTQKNHNTTQPYKEEY